MTTQRFSRRDLFSLTLPSWSGGPNALSLYTPTAQFYRPLRTTLPAIALDHWRLTVIDAPSRLTHLSFANLLDMPSHAIDATLWSASQHQDEPRIATGRWKGIRIRHILGDLREQAVTLTAADGSRLTLNARSVHDALLAYALNDEMLPYELGFPLRLIVPGAFDHEMLGWVRRIEHTTGVHNAVAEPVGNAPRAIVTLNALARLTAGQAATISGYAYAGLRAIECVEMRLNREAWLPVPFLVGAPGVWTRWRADWTPAYPGWWLVEIRATTADGVTEVTQRKLYVASEVHV